MIDKCIYEHFFNKKLLTRTTFINGFGDNDCIDWLVIKSSSLYEHITLSRSINHRRNIS